MSSLRSFLDEVRAHQKVQQALAAGMMIDGTPIADHLVAMELFFDALERHPSQAVIELHDVVVQIINSDAPLKQRLEAIAGRRVLDCRR